MSDERVWRMRRLGPGDYILPSNDLQTLWRICKEAQPDGDDTWDLFRWRKPAPIIEEDVALAIVEDDWTDWSCAMSGLRTRAAAVEEAISRG